MYRSGHSGNVIDLRRRCLCGTADGVLALARQRSRREFFGPVESISTTPAKLGRRHARR